MLPTNQDNSLINENANNLLPIEEIFLPAIEDASEISNIQKTPSNTLEIKEDSPKIIDLKRKLQEVQTTLELKSKQVRLLQKRCCRQKTKINSLNTIICELSKINSIPKTAQLMSLKHA